MILDNINNFIIFFNNIMMSIHIVFSFISANSD